MKNKLLEDDSVCSNCIYYHPVAGVNGEEGQCRANPPTVGLEVFPAIKNALFCWCGWFEDSRNYQE